MFRRSKNDLDRLVDKEVNLYLESKGFMVNNINRQLCGLIGGCLVGLIIIMLGELTSAPTVCPLPEINQANVLSLE